FAGANRAREVQLRGIGPEYAQVLVNGRRILDANSKRSVQLDHIPSSLVERVEIIRSPLASQEGQGAAGTVNIILKQRAKSGNGEIGIGAGHM
ncbi:TonB-dependent receptor plug domain-containing protein, partial [Escherichia coli]